MTSGYGLTSQLDERLVTNHSVTLNELTTATTYHFCVTSRDAAANEAVSKDFCFNTVLSWASLNGPPGGKSTN